MQCVLLFIATIIACALSETKVWMPKGQSVDEWYSHPIKCPKTALRFENDTLEFFEGYSHEREIIFAVTGYYIFQNNGQMVIGDSPHVQADDCKNAFGEEVLVHSVKPQPWASPDNWYSETNNNPAKPDIEKIPCDGDEVVFNNTVTRVDLTDIFRLQMSRVSIMDKWLKPRELGSFCKTVPGQKMFENCEYVEMMQSMDEPEIRACQSNAELMQRVVCDNVQCAPAKCESPIRPQGFCCDICGASASVEVHHNSNIKLDDLNGIISRKLAQVAPGAGISFHSSFFNYETKFRLHLTLAERDEYSGESIRAMDKIANDLLRKRFDNLVLLKSGMPYDPTQKSNLLALIFMPLLAVTVLFLGAYKISYDDTVNFNWRSVVQRFTGRSEFIFAQFENVLEDHEGRITISTTKTPVVSTSAVETAVECGSEDAGMEMMSSGSEVNTILAKDKLDEIVETISSTSDSVNLISVDM